MNPALGENDVIVIFPINGMPPVMIVNRNIEHQIMSNYFFAMGKEPAISTIHRKVRDLLPDSESEISVSSQSNGYSILIVERRSEQTITSIQSDTLQEGKSGYFFKGWFQDHDSKSIVIGSTGYKKWKKMHGKSHPLEFEGTYVHANWTEQKLTIENDLFSYFPVIYFSTPDVIVASDSMYVLSRIRRMLNLPCKLNHDVIHSRSWTHGLACAVMSNQTQIQGIEILSPGKHIESTLGDKLSTRIIHKSIKEIFQEKHASYAEALVQATRQLYASTMSFSHIEDIHLNFGLSGGLDSRLLLAILLKNLQSLSKVSITTNTHATRRGDFQVVSDLSKKYNFEFNNKKEELAEHRKNPQVKSIREDNTFGYWVLSNMGIFDMMYLHNSYWKHPNVIDLGGHGAETVKGTFASMKFENYLHRKKLSRKARFSRSYFRDRKAVKKSQKTYDSIQREMQVGLASSGIDLDEPGSIQWHHLCYKSPIQNGRFLDRSIIALRPFIQRSLFALSRSELNPFIAVKKGEPTLLHDMLILLDSELAAEPFENSKNNLTESYIQERLQTIDVEISFEDIKPYTIFGAATDVVNGPPRIFMQMVADFDIEDSEPKTAILRMLEERWAKIEGTKLGDVYQSAYDTAKERLLDPDFYPPSAGTPAAKIISLMMTDL